MRGLSRMYHQLAPSLIVTKVLKKKSGEIKDEGDMT